MAIKAYILLLGAMIMSSGSAVVAEPENIDCNCENYWSSFKTGYLAGIYPPLLPITFIKPFFNTIRDPHWDTDKSIGTNLQDEKKTLKRSYMACGTGVIAGWATITLCTILAYRMIKKII